jgi:hypothetical protein
VSNIYVAEEPLQGMLTIIQFDTVFDVILGYSPENVLVKKMLAVIQYCFSFTF